MKNPSYGTILTTVNTMMGSSCLIVPLVFLKSGLVTSILVLLCVGYASFKMASILLIHGKRNEDDLSIIVRRILGKK